MNEINLARPFVGTSGLSVVAETVVGPVRAPEKPMLCRGTFGFVKHSWLELEPSTEELEEIRRLVSHRRGALGRLGVVRMEDIVDRVCYKCHHPEPRMKGFIASLRVARGEV